ncbi:aspartate aminotransferase family protein [Chromohalobacter sp.]|uniref:pyridoxal phosphate-dependent decarboxylase family protein n=1 Tax=Chromohalobacter sp. TaxID=50740 RepID=UPI001E007D47|nr:aspartate aminotransferase family protein [Chromohalobacter sp.]NQY47462.1 aspartate aminotransferase family protein [Chromohalobacter sp.]
MSQNAAIRMAPLSSRPLASRAMGEDANHALFMPRNADAYRQGMQRCIELVQRKLTETGQPFSGILPSEMQRRFEGLDLNHRLDDLDAVLAEVERLYLDDAVYFHHPRYVAHLNCPITLASILAEAIATPINTAVETWDQSAGGTFIEQALIDWTVRRIGLGDDADGVFTSGGTQSNLMALLIARDHRCAALDGHQGNREYGLPADAARLRIFASEASHVSLQKAAALLGLGHRAVVPIPCDDRYRMDTGALAHALAESRQAGTIPMAVVATAGTTDFGSIDPLADIAALCRQHGVWLHVDAAYGGGLLTSPRHRHWLAGIEQADSVSVDYHKSFFQPVSCSAFMVAERQRLGYVTHHADYLNPAGRHDDAPPDLVDKSLQTTRRLDALKLWMTLRLLGPDALGELFDRVIALTREAYHLLRTAPDIEVVTAPQLTTLVFRYRPRGHDLDDASLDTLNAHIRQALSRHGEAVVAATRVRGRRYLKFTLLNPETGIDDLATIVERLQAHGADFLTRDDAAPPRRHDLAAAFS